MIVDSGPSTGAPADAVARPRGRPAAGAGPAAGSDAPAHWVRRWAVFIGAAFAVGLVLRLAGLLPHDALAPLHARPRLLLTGLLPAGFLAVSLVAALPVAARYLRWRRLLATGWLAAFGWAAVLAGSDGGVDALGRPLTHPTEYLRAVGTVGNDPIGWLRGFTEHLGQYPTHVEGHPPLPVLLLWALDRAGLGGPHWAGVIVIGAGSSAVVAIAITLRVVAGEAAARAALPFLILAPYAVWIATSMDALFLGVGAWATALLAIAVKTAHPHPPGGSVPSPLSGTRRSADKPVAALWTTRSGMALTWAFAAGVLLGSLPYLSYGLLPLAAVPAAVVLLRRPPLRLPLAACAGAITVIALVTAAGFWWPDGVAATARAWAAHAGGPDRPYWYFVVSNLAVLALVVGPAAARVLPDAIRDGAAFLRAATARHPDTSRYAVVAIVIAALAGAVLLDLAGITRGEVERIWLPYAAWVAAVSAYHRPPARGPLAAQATVGLALQAFVGSIW